MCESHSIFTKKTVTMNLKFSTDTICAIATAPGMSAIGVVRISGEKTTSIVAQCFKAYKNFPVFESIPVQRVVLGTFEDNGEPVDEVMITRFKNPHSYTGEDLVEISCHGSPFIQQEILRVLVEKGARMAKPGEFTLRAFLNGRIDLSQAEAIADLIASNSNVSQKIAYNQMRGHFSDRIKVLRQQLITFASLIELELDFSEEDLEFASRNDLISLLDTVDSEISNLKQSFSMGNVIKNGIPVVIVGKPNVGKSTLLNAFVNEERAIVSDLPGTTRDAIEDTITLNGITFRFIDTAGLRDSLDVIESIGIQRTYQKIKQAAIVLYLFDVSETSFEEITETLQEFKAKFQEENQRIILVANKIDLIEEIPSYFPDLVELETIFISAKRKENIHMITDSLLKSVAMHSQDENYAIVTNARHYEALWRTSEALDAIRKGIGEKLSGDLLATDLRTALYHLGSITGEVSNQEILNEIFSRFCIGK